MTINVQATEEPRAASPGAAKASQPVVDLLSARESSDALVGFASLAEFFGINARQRSAETWGAPPFGSTPERPLSLRCRGLVVDVASCTGLDHFALARLASAIDNAEHPILFLVTRADVATQAVLSLLAGEGAGRIIGLDEAVRVRFPDGLAERSQHLAAFTYARGAKPALALLDTKPDAEVLMSLEDSPALVLFRNQRGSRFVWATPAVAHAMQTVSVEQEFESILDEYVPVLMFLRHVFGDACWHAPVYAAAIVIDDPLVRRRYGFLDFELLLESARRLKYRVTLAYIPWNYARARLSETSAFVARQDCFELCVHGCDHTRHEFESRDYPDLLDRSVLAMSRMKALKDRTGLPVAPVMVFPQEKFSEHAVRAVADSGAYLGITNTRCIPTSSDSLKVTVADLLLPAQDALHGISMFKRHYFQGMESFAMSLFLGRPTIMAAHHGDFEGGPSDTERFAQQLAVISSKTQWLSLEETVVRVHWRRHLPDGAVELRFFANRFCFDHATDVETRYRLIRRLPQSTQLDAVLVNGERAEYRREADFVCFEVTGNSPMSHEVQVLLTLPERSRMKARPLLYRMRVGLRRLLSEVRDELTAALPRVLRSGWSWGKRLAAVGKPARLLRMRSRRL